MSLKRIALISYHTCPLASQEGKETGGMNIYVLELARELAKQGVQIDIFTRSQDVDNPFLVHIENGLRLIHLPAGPQKSLPKKELLQYVDDFVKNFFEFVATEKVSYDLLYCHYYMSGLAGQKIQTGMSAIGGHTKKLPMVFTYHTLGLMKNLVARNELEQENKERIDIEISLGQTADKIIAASSNDAEYLHYLYEVPESKVVTIPPGVNVELFQPIDQKKAKQKIGADLDHHLVLFVGRIEPLKGVDGLIYAIKILSEKDPNTRVCLWIVGGDTSQTQKEWSAELQKLEKLRLLLRIPTTVHFAGQQSQEQLRYYYNAADVVVMPSHYESFGMAAAEAMACGTPVIMTNVAGISRMLDENHRGLVTTVNNPLLLASQIEHVLENQISHEVVAQELMEKVQDLRWQLIAARIKKVLEEVAREAMR